MSVLIDERLDLFLLDGALWMLTKPTGKAVYDFQFQQFFQRKHKRQFPSDIEVIAVELHTVDINRFLTYENMADDIGALITYLSFDEADIAG